MTTATPNIGTAADWTGPRLFGADEPEVLGVARLARHTGLSATGGLNAVANHALTARQRQVLAAHRDIVRHLSRTVTVAACMRCGSWRYATIGDRAPTCVEGGCGRMRVAGDTIKGGTPEPGMLT